MKNFIISAFLVFSLNVSAQEKIENADITTLKIALEALKRSHESKVAELQHIIFEIQKKLEAKEQEDELKKLLEEATRLSNVEKGTEQGVGKKFRSGVRSQAKLNPNISVSGDFFAGKSTIDNSGITEPGEFTNGSDGFYLRETEISFQAALDPFTRGKVFLAITEDEVAIEEGYIEWLNLPLNLNLKIGAFFPEIGILNRYHTHSLPQFDRPKALVNLFGNENFGGHGLSANFLLNALPGSDATMLDAAVFQGGEDISFTANGDSRLLYSGNLTTYYDLTESTFFEWRLGAVTGYNDPAERYRTVIGNAAFNLKWQPIDRSRYRTFDLKSEFLFSKRETPIKTFNSFGFYTSLQNKLNSQWWLVARAGYSEMPDDPENSEWDFVLGADYWQSEFVRLRMQFQFIDRNYMNIHDFNGIAPDNSAFTLQVSWAMGPHKHEAY